MEMITSVIIPTYNGAHKVVKALDSLLLQRKAADEIIVVIDGSTDNTKEIIIAKNYPFQRLVILEQANGGRAKVRNYGARQAQGDLLLFLDDDMVVPNNWVEQHWLHHVQHHNTLVTGKLLSPEYDKTNDFQQYKAWLNIQWNRDIDTQHSQSDKPDIPYITANNFSVPKSLFFELNGFDERLTDAEDYDLAMRAHQHNKAIYFSTNCYAWHHDNPSCGQYIYRLKEYQQAQKQLLQLKPELYAKNHRYAVQFPSGIKKMIYLFFANQLWVKAIDRQWLTIIPSSFRYRLYNIIITSKGVYNF